MASNVTEIKHGRTASLALEGRKDRTFEKRAPSSLLSGDCESNTEFGVSDSLALFNSLYTT
jgi:hypothetical protein